MDTLHASDADVGSEPGALGTVAPCMPRLGQTQMSGISVFSDNFLTDG